MADVTEGRSSQSDEISTTDRPIDGGGSSAEACASTNGDLKGGKDGQRREDVERSGARIRRSEGRKEKIRRGPSDHRRRGRIQCVTSKRHFLSEPVLPNSASPRSRYNNNKVKRDYRSELIILYFE
ncbi:unnamed protein product [Nesidiocoris tenuis]|uniref:Uncharacterized protein n=1 Tax=Nesidiocoris tenuis TaxID=355587 RepID=A0A6H5H1B9_9HEMI|nr:unnamed protein product [Nesidiocoris tenuis]